MFGLKINQKSSKKYNVVYKERNIQNHTTNRVCLTKYKKINKIWEIPNAKVKIHTTRKK